MCGICFVAYADERPVDKSTINNMVMSLRHRGPDEQNFALRGSVALGHTRLSIVDIKGGSQPVVSDDGRYALSYNGEIYNYRQLKSQLQDQGVHFNSDSDSEVVLQMFIKHQHECVHYLRGMFAFVVHDRSQGRLFAARDRLGIKPLFFAHGDSFIAGASEIKGVFASRLIEPEFNRRAIQDFFHYQFSVPPETTFKGVCELLPGHTLDWSPAQGIKTKSYWDVVFPKHDEYETLDEMHWQQKFESALHDATQSHMIGDVPIGAYLSGGIDSSTTTYLLKQHYPQDLQTFTIRFSNPAADESDISRGIAKHLQVANEEVEIDDHRADGYLHSLRSAIYHVEQAQRMALDVPFYLLSQRVHELNYKVVYTGDGADEIMGGYDCFRQDYMRVWGNAQKNRRLRRRHYLNEYTQYFSQDHVRLLLRLHQTKNQKRTISQFGCYPAWKDFWHILDDSIEGLFSTDFDQSAEPTQSLVHWAESIQEHIHNRHPLNQSLYMELKTRLPGWILWKTDRLSMANSVEARVPFLDHPLVELLAQVPPGLKLNNMDEKYLLRKIMLPFLPQHPQQFKKRAFYTPIREWFFNQQNYASLHEFMSPAALKEAGIFNSHTVSRLAQQLLAVADPQNMDDAYRIMKMEWILMNVLTIQILHSLFIKKQAPCFK